MGDAFFVWALVLLIVVIAVRLKFKTTRRKLLNKRAPEPQAGEQGGTEWMPVIPWSAQRIADLDMGWLRWLQAAGHEGLQRLIDRSLACRRLDEAEVSAWAVEGCDDGRLEYFKALVYRGCLYPALRDKEKETRLLQLAADKGCGEAFFDLAQREFVNAIGRREQDAIKLAENLYQQAAGRGQAGAMFMLGVLSISGSLRAGARQQGMEWLKQAADTGHRSAQYLLGRIYLDSDSPYCQPQRGIEYLRRAAAQDHPGALLSQARLDKALSKAEAKTLVRQAAGRGLAAAQLALALYCFEDRQPGQALEWADRAAAQQRPGAFILLTRLAAGGQLCEQDYDSALNRWFRFETGERNSLELAMHLYLAAVWYATAQQAAPAGIGDALSAVAELLDADFAEIDFDRIYRLLDELRPQDPYTGFLLWLFSDYCESTGREDNLHRLHAAVEAGLRVALLTRYFLSRHAAERPKKNLFAKRTEGAHELLWQQVRQGCAAACYLAAQQKIDAQEFAEALELLRQAAAAGHPEALLRNAYLSLGRLDYELDDEGFAGLLRRDDEQGIALLEQAAERGQRHAAELLSRLFLQGGHLPRDFSKALYYHRFALQNFSEEESLVRHMLTALRN